MLLRFTRNILGHDYVVGDIHGCYQLLARELERIGFDHGRDRLFSVGDLIDRGPCSLDCLKLVFEPWFHAVRGNHEMLAQEALERGRWSPWLLNGGDWARGQDRQLLRRLLQQALARMPYALEIESLRGRIGIVHAEPPTDWSQLERRDDGLAHELIWSRRRIEQGNEAPIAGIDAVVVGHTILEEPLWLGNVHYIDTGAFISGRLTIKKIDDLMP